MLLPGDSYLELTSLLVYNIAITLNAMFDCSQTIGTWL